jgi:3-ketosteroid 9alpha-monooxygenase subunit B
MPAQTYDLRIAEVVHETHDTCSFVLEVPDDLAEQFRYQAGQFLTVHLPWKEWTIQRCYSLSSAPALDPLPRITVKRVANGRVSNWLCDHMRAGDSLRLQRPEGRFVLDPSRGDEVPLCLLGGGSGVTPIRSLLAWALAHTSRPVLLLDAHRSMADALFRADIDALAAQWPRRLTVHHHLDSNGGFLTASTLRALLAGREAGDFYVCGPAPFMELVDDVLQSIGVSTTHAHFERFVSPIDPDRRIEPAPVSVDTATPEAFELQLDGRKHTVPYTPGKTLLACALDHGVPAPHACQDGFCGSCMAHLVTGQVTMDRHEALAPGDLERGRVLLCQSRPKDAGPLAVTFDAVSFALPKPQAPTEAGEETVSRLSWRVLAVVVAIGALLVGAVRWWR